MSEIGELKKRLKTRYYVISLWDKSTGQFMGWIRNEQKPTGEPAFGNIKFFAGIKLAKKYAEENKLSSKYDVAFKYFKQTFHAPMLAILDEAKADFLKKVSFGNLEHMRQFIVYHKEKNDIGSGFIEALEWFLQWFGDKK